MASYRDKINQKKMETESGKIAFAVELLEHDYKIKAEAEKHTVALYDNYALSREGLLSWCVYKVGKEDYEDYYKIIPKDSDWDTCQAVLEAQPWRCL